MTNDDAKAAPPPDDLLPSLRLASTLWLVAYALHIVEKLTYLPHTLRDVPAASWPASFASMLGAPNIAGPMSMAPHWFDVSLMTQVIIVLSVTAALAWAGACCLVGSAIKEAAPKPAAWALIAVAVAALLCGLAVDRLMLADQYWLNQVGVAIHLLDPAAGVLMALVLRAAAPRVGNRTFAAMLTPLLWLSIARAAQAVELVAPQVRYPVHFVINLCTIAGGLLFAVVMFWLRLALASRQPLNPSAA